MIRYLTLDEGLERQHGVLPRTGHARDESMWFPLIFRVSRPPG